MLRRAAGALVLLAVVACSGGGTVVERSLDRLEDDDDFDTAFEAGDAFAAIGARLQEEGAERSSAAMLSASAYAQVLAVRVLDCTAPGRFEAREAMRTYLRAIAGVDDDAPAPQPPPAPDCR